MSKNRSSARQIRKMEKRRRRLEKSEAYRLQKVAKEGFPFIQMSRKTAQVIFECAPVVPVVIPEVMGLPGGSMSEKEYYRWIYSGEY